MWNQPPFDWNLCMIFILTSSMLIRLFLALPFGMLANKYGRKWFMVLNVTGLSLRLFWTYIVCEYLTRSQNVFRERVGSELIIILGTYRQFSSNLCDSDGLDQRSVRDVRGRVPSCIHYVRCCFDRHHTGVWAVCKGEPLPSLSRSN